MELIVLSLSPHNLQLLFCCVLSVLALIYLVLMALFYAAIRRDSVSLLRFPLFSHIQVFACLSLEMFIQLFFLLFLFYGYSCSVDAYVVCIVSSDCNQSSSAFLCNLLVTEIWRILFLLFLTHTVCQRHLWDVRPYTSSWIFFFCIFVEVLILYILRMVPSILRGEQPKYLSLWWDFFYIVWLSVVFSFSWDILFSFIFAYLMVSASNIPKYL